MGCGGSKSGLHHVDDSVHVMLRHDKKVHQRKGGPAPAYKARAEHPLLKPKEVTTPKPTTPSGGDANGAAAATDDKEPIATEE